MHDSPTFLNILDVSLCIYTFVYITLPECTENNDGGSLSLCYLD